MCDTSSPGRPTKARKERPSSVNFLGFLRFPLSFSSVGGSSQRESVPVGSLRDRYAVLTFCRTRGTVHTLESVVGVTPPWVGVLGVPVNRCSPYDSGRPRVVTDVLRGSFSGCMESLGVVPPASPLFGGCVDLPPPVTGDVQNLFLEKGDHFYS